MFCAQALRKIITTRAHKAKALDHTLGLHAVSSGAKGFSGASLRCAPPRGGGAEETCHISLSCDEAISFLVNAKHEETHSLYSSR
jgi:hypothetical protein